MQGRKIQFSEFDVAKLAYLGLSNRHIAMIVGCHPSVIDRRSDIRAIVGEHRASRAADIAACWLRSPGGSLADEARAAQLAELVTAAERRSVRRMKPA
ncbi:MAG: hypothetical protein ACLQVD_08005 [Capsulimonadaceae bacterium]